MPPESQLQVWVREWCLLVQQKQTNHGAEAVFKAIISLLNIRLFYMALPSAASTTRTGALFSSISTMHCPVFSPSLQFFETYLNPWWLAQCKHLHLACSGGGGGGRKYTFQQCHFAMQKERHEFKAKRRRPTDKRQRWPFPASSPQSRLLCSIWLVFSGHYFVLVCSAPLNKKIPSFNSM